jgi:hypothetical protein
MSVKAVYSSGTLNIYITQSDLSRILRNGSCMAELCLHKDALPIGFVSVNIPPESLASLRSHHQFELETIAQAKALYLRHKPPPQKRGPKPKEKNAPK